MPAPFATVAELGTYLQTATEEEASAGSTDVLDTNVATLALASASGAIRAVCGWTISEEIATETVVDWSYGLIDLPTLRLTALTVTVNGAPAVDGTDFIWRRNGIVRLPMIARWSLGSIATLTLAYTHGFTVIPDGLKAVCLELAAQSYINPEQMVTSGRGGITDTFRSLLELDLSRDYRVAPYVLSGIA